jgi:hypothetical protein
MHDIHAAGREAYTAPDRLDRNHLSHGEVGRTACRSVDRDRGGVVVVNFDTADADGPESGDDADDTRAANAAVVRDLTRAADAALAGDLPGPADAAFTGDLPRPADAAFTGDLPGPADAPLVRGLAGTADARLPGRLSRSTDASAALGGLPGPRRTGASDTFTRGLPGTADTALAQLRDAWILGASGRGSAHEQRTGKDDRNCGKPHEHGT